MGAPLRGNTRGCGGATGLTKPPINVATLRFDRTAALLDARVRVQGVNFFNTPGGAASVDGLLSGAFDVADVPLVRYVYWRYEGRPFTAIPVFNDRLFQRQYIYTRPDANISGLRDLRGRRVMSAPTYFSTPGFWHRALLKDEAGIEPHEIEWYVANAERGGMKLPPNIKATVRQASLLGLERLLDGTVDCLMTARTAMVPPDRRDHVIRVIPDAYERDREAAKKNGYFPILHVLAIRSESLAKRPTLAEELCRGFDEAKEHAYRLLQDERMWALPFMRGYLDDTMAMWGDDPWPYGVERNRAELTQFLAYAHEQGLTDRQMSVGELFDNDAAGYAFRARMTPGCITGVMDGGWAPAPTYPAAS